MSRAARGRRPRAPFVVLAAGCGSAVLTWLSLTTAPALPAGGALVLTVAVVVVAVVVALRSTGAHRWLAAGGGLVAALPVLAVAAFLSVSDG